MNKKIAIKAKPDNTDDASIAAMALVKQNAGQYKEAIELYKQLLKRADNKAWRLALAHCYLQRAFSFAEKGMVKEAVVLWENYSQNAQAPYQGYDCYIAWLFQTNNIAKVKTCLSRLSAQQLDEHYPNLAGLLGLLIITEKPELEAMLPKDSAFVAHLGFVRAALAAYRNNKPEDVEQALQQLPFRSAFRDFRTLVKAALSLPESREQAQSLLTKIPAASPYYQSAQLLLTTLRNGSVLVNDLLQFDFKQRQIIGAVKGFSKKQIELLETWVKQKDSLSDKIKFNTAIQYRELLGLDLAKAYCRAMLITYPAGQRDFNKHFGEADEFEQFRLKALKNERSMDHDSAEYYWKQGIALLKKQGAPAAFKIALIMRHVAAHKRTPEESVQWLVDSLDHDSGDRDSYLKILQYYEHQQQADVYKQWLDKAIKAFPSDIDMLVQVIKAALANKAFKKATQYAQAILKIDPVNTFAKQVLFTSHLAHARKLIKTKKFHLVEKEIQQAEKLNIGKRYQAQAQLMRGFFVFMTEDKKQGLQQIADAAQKMNEGSLCAHFCIVMETLLMGLTLAPILKDLPAPAKNYQLPEQELARLVQLVQQYHSNDNGNQALLHKALDKIKAIIKQSVKQQKYSEETLLMLCQCLDGIGHFELLRYCSKIAWSRWIKPIWVFYRTYAEANGQADQCSNFDIVKLKFQLDEAHKQSDDRTVMLIAKFIEQYYKAHNPLGGGFFDDNFDDDDDFDEEASSIDLFDHLPEELFNKIQKKMEEIMRRNPLDRVINAISKLASKKLDVSFILTNPDTFWGLLALHAASELGIDTGVSAEQVLNFAPDDAGTNPFPFPFF